MLQGKPHYLFINLCSLCKTAEPTQPPSFPKPLIEVGEVEPGLLTQVCDSQLWVTEAEIINVILPFITLLLIVIKTTILGLER